MVARIVPSPDWFVGVDSLDLCADGHWIDTITVEVCKFVKQILNNFFYDKASPLDAGTDSGFTFTAPNWATVPQEGIYKITSQYPRHMANSFYYPHLPDLPAIATFQIIKVWLKLFNLFLVNLTLFIETNRDCEFGQDN